MEKNITSITPENITTFRNYGFALTPVKMDKSPATKNGSWCKDWSDTELLNAKRIGVFHKDSGIQDVDFDDKNFIAHKFIDMLPPTLTIGKYVDGVVIGTHKTYKIPNDEEANRYSFPSSANKGDKIIEILTSTQTIIAGVDRVIINNVEPIEINPTELQMHCRLIAAFSELYLHWPKPDSKMRDEAFLKLAGALTRETDIPTHIKEKYVEKLCHLTGDEEVRSRVNKVKYQEKKYKEDPDQVAGIKSLSQYLGDINLKAFDEIKRIETAEPLKSKEYNKVAKGLVVKRCDHFLAQTFPKPNYILYPIIATNQIRQVFAKAGTGKTLYSLHEAAAIASGYDFLDFKNHDNQKHPVLYVEAEMDSSSIQDRLYDIEEAFEREGKILNKEFMFFATLANQEDMHFESLTAEVGRQNVEISAQRVFEETGLKPIIYLDNITALTIMQEKEGEEWVELMQWLSRLRNQGYHVTFLHHPTKQGKTASGSNVKERSIDIDMKLSVPDEKVAVPNKGEGYTQIQLEWLKWREHMNTSASRPRIAVIQRSTNSWQMFPLFDQTKRKIATLLAKGKTPDEIMKANKDVKGFSKANVYKLVEQLKDPKIKEEKKDAVNKQDTNGNAEDVF
jgi:KaiC/GvpD/RAD55 family RecA-like ATPase